ncbi:hypothetical protein MMC30_003246 [Trapelia coarctata]|nr:hypothetical protein [Trapelia coarctata]
MIKQYLTVIEGDQWQEYVRRMFITVELLTEGSTPLDRASCPYCKVLAPSSAESDQKSFVEFSEEKKTTPTVPMECSWDGELLALDSRVISELPKELVEVLHHGTNPQFLDSLSLLALDPRRTASIYSTHRSLFVDICNRWVSNVGAQFPPLEVVSALSRILHLAPELSVYVEELVFKQRADAFDTLLSKKAMGLSELPDVKIVSILTTVNHLLEFDNHAFASMVSPVQLQMLLHHPQLCIRFLAIRALCSFLHAADAVFHEMVKKYVGNDEIEGPWEDKTIDYRFFHLWEEKRLKELETLLANHQRCQIDSVMQASTIRIIRDEDLSQLTVSFAGVLVPTIVHGPLVDTSSYVMTETSRQNLRATADAISSSKPLLVTGVSGSGKTTVIRQLAKGLNKASTMLTLHLNEQTDAKLLIGMYTSGNTPGSFNWQAGVLTTAVREGRWVLVEDLDRAPAEVISTLLPLLDRGELIVPNLGGPVRAARGFKLIATFRSSSNTRGEEVTPGLGMLGFRHWTRIHLCMLSDQDLNDIVLTRFPILHAFLPRTMRLYCGLVSMYRRSPARSSQLLGRPQGPHDLIRYCSRLQSLLAANGTKSGHEPVSEAVIDNVFMEAVDCFAGSTEPGPPKDRIIAQIAQELQVPPERAKYCTHSRTPEYLDRGSALTIGRATLSKRENIQTASIAKSKTIKRPFAATDHALRQLESIGVAISMSEPCLLVGETGTGKTTIIQELASVTGHNLVVVNLSQQSEAGDLLGGYKPVSVRAIVMPLQEEFQELFDRTFSAQKNQQYIKSLARTIARGEWTRTLTLWQEALKLVEKLFAPPTPKTVTDGTEKPKKRRKLESSTVQKLRPRWDSFASDVESIQQHVLNGSKTFSFSFVEGNIVKAVRRGDWVLLDEINLASPDTLESISDLLSDKTDGAPTLLLSETGDIERIQAHPEFKIFGAMNPATDVGKRDLPLSLRSRFTEYFIGSPDKDLDSLKQIISAYLGTYLHGDIGVAQDIAQLYLEIKSLEEQNRLADGAEQKPHYSLRTLTRTLTYVSDIAPLYGLRRALYEGFSMSFLTLLSKESELLVRPLIDTHLLGGQRNRKALLHQMPRQPSHDKKYVQFRHYWVAQGSFPIQEQPHYIITPFIESNLLNLVRATSTRRFPVLLQGPTSSGKTSMVEYLAKLSGNRFVRINNHEHTDLQEYMGTYISDSEGRLQYQEGILVRALREGYWIVLDELNLAPTDVLEALNRLLDDNRELLIPETQQIVRPHENFMLFATQNPPGLYGGRKVLSRAFRNRFLELHFDDIPENELETILRERTQIAPSFCSRIVTVYKKLAVLRQSGRLFEQRNSFATLRDLFRWALRDADDRDQLAINGFMLLAERVRNPEERLVVKQVIEEVMRVKIDEDHLYNIDNTESLDKLGADSSKPGLDIVWTTSIRRLYVLISQALNHNEPVLLVGPTGCGKTSVCQAIAQIMHKQLHIMNAHQNTETGDLIGAQRPVRNRSFVEGQLRQDLATLFRDRSIGFSDGFVDLDAAIAVYESLADSIKQQVPVELCDRIEQHISKVKQLFEWVDGSLVVAMKAGHHFLVDEISLADDSVLERLNSVLEPERTLLLAEKGPYEALVKAADGFEFLATMNPGGDYGKKELSPALRNRFTEIWVPPLSNTEDIIEIVQAKLHPSLRQFAIPMVDFSAWYCANYDDLASSASIRQVLTWVHFLNVFGLRDAHFSILHGAAMAFIDGLGANPSAKLSLSQASISVARQACLEKLTKLFTHDMLPIYNERTTLSHSKESLRFGCFELAKATEVSFQTNFNLEAPTTLNNALRIVRALQLQKPVLLEGSPGVGKTTLVTTLASAVGMPLTRINLSEQTDIMDLFGSDVPVEGGSAGQFAWRDAPFLQAMQRGEWVLLDEMNLASQSILEGLNACLDHRGQVYVPELDQTFVRHPRFVLFAAQNPHRQGGGRKGLPASFVNRFTVVYADLLTPTDLLMICNKLYPGIPTEKTEALVRYVTDLGELTGMSQGTLFSGGPWEFNLRDMLRWLHLLDSQQSNMLVGHLADYLGLLFFQRFRSRADVAMILNRLPLLERMGKQYHSTFYNMSQLSYQCGLGLLERHGKYQPQSTGGFGQDLGILESLVLCVQHNWPCLLVGPSGSGKSSAIRYLGSVTGAEIVELPLNSDMDTMDLVGGYEQVNTQRLTSEFLGLVRVFISESLIDDLLSGADTTTVSDLLQSTEAAAPDLDRVLHLLRRCSNVSSDPRCGTLIEHCTFLVNQSSIDNRARFEWVDGVLIKALEKGQWLVLDNANLCSSSVLDRLNSLLEPNGVLAVNEYHKEDGSAKVISPHKNFRLFLTMDPRYGELSRAMRNRCIEVFLFPSTDSSNSTWGKSFCESLTFRFRIIDNFQWNTYDDAFAGALASVCIDHLAFKDFGYIQSWWSQVMEGLIHIQPAKLQLFFSILKAYMEVASQQKATWTSIWQMYRTLSMETSNNEDFSLAQTIHPLNNAPLLPIMRRDCLSSRHVCFAGLLETLVDLHILKQELLAIESSMHHKSASQMSRLERSIASSRNRAFSKDSTQPLEAFLEQALLLLTDWIEREAPQCSNIKAALTIVKELRDYVRDVLDSTRALKFDEGVFQSYLVIGRSLVMQALQCLDTRKLGSTVQARLDMFKASWDLTTGTSMEILWNSFRPPTARDSRELDLVLRVERLADRFDSIVWRSNAPLTTVIKLRRSILGVNPLEQTANLPDEDSLKPIEEAVNGIEERLSSSTAIAYPHFHEEFEGLRQYSAPTAKDQPLGKRNSLDLVAGWASRRSIFLGECTTANQLLTQIRDFTGTHCVDSSLIALRGVLPISTLCKLHDITEVPLRSLNLLSQEVQLLAEYTTHACHSMSQNQYAVLNSYLRQLHSEFFEAHAAFLNAESIEACKRHLTGTRENAPRLLLTETVNQSPSARMLLNTINTHIGPSLKHLRQAENGPSQRASTAIAWVSFFIACLLLYVPDRTFDPALKPMIECERYMKRKAELETKLRALQLFEEKLTGQTTNLRCELVMHQLHLLGTQPQVPAIARPSTTELPQLQGEFNNLLNSVIRRCPGVESILLAIEGDVTATQELRLLRRNIDQIVHRLSNNFRIYDDITKPVISLLGGLDVGLAVAMISNSHHSDPQETTELIFEHTPFLGLQPSYLDRITHSEQVESIDTDLRMPLLRLGAINHGIYGRVDSASNGTILKAFQCYYEDWKQQLGEDQSNESAKTSLYRYRGGQDENEVASDEDFEELFPSYDKPSQEGKSSDLRMTYRAQALAPQLADYHRLIFVNHDEPADQILHTLKDATEELVRLWKNKGNASSHPLASNAILPSLMVALTSEFQRLLNPIHSDQTYNFYVDANLAEARKLVDFIARIQDRFRTIQQSWPEHATLEDILRTSDEILAFRHTEPLAKIITKCEQLHRYIHEWQIVASKEYSALGLYNELTELLISWRRLELSTWSRLLDVENRKCIEDAKGWWFVAYEAVIAASVSTADSTRDVSLHSMELIATLEHFFRQTSIGQYAERLHLIETFNEHLGLLVQAWPSLQAVRTAIINFLRFHTRFVPGVEETLRKGRSNLERSMKEITLLASWKDTNITALRESAKRSHHKLFKVIRKYRDLLGQPVEAIVKQGIPELSTTAGARQEPFIHAVPAVDVSAIEACRMNVQKWDSRPTRYTDPEKTILIMDRLRKDPYFAFDYSLYLDSFCINLTETIKVLQRETPSVLTTENKDTVKHLKSRKRKVFADTLKEIRGMGFSSNPGTDILSKQASLPMMLSASPALESSQFTDTIGVAEYYFHKSLENIAVIRESAPQHSDDLSSGEVARSVGYLETIISTSLKQRYILAKSLAEFETFEALSDKLQSTWAPNQYTLHLQAEVPHLASTDSVERRIKWVPSIIEVGVAIIKQHNSMGDIDSSMVIESLLRWKNCLAGLSNQLEKLPKLPPRLTTSLHIQLIADSERALEGLAVDLKAWELERPLIGFVLNQILPWTISDTGVYQTNMNGVVSCTVGDVENQLALIVDTILVGTQRLQETLSLLPTSHEENAWLLRADSLRTQSLNTLHLHQVSEQLESTMSQLQHVSLGMPQTLSIAAAFCAVALPVVRNYGITYKEAIQRYLSFHGSLCRMACVLTTSFRQIAVEGFCSPSEKSAAESGKTEKLEEGTGLGEGEGAEDISKDIQDDEDLSELAQEGTKDKHQGDIEDEEDAVDMQGGELEGELGDAGSDKEESGSESGSDASNGDMDEQAGEVDDLDPGAVDEKLWEGSAEETDRDKEGDQSKGKKQNEMAAQDDTERTEEGQAAEEEEMEEAGAQESEEVSREELEKTDPHLQDGQTLELPEEMTLDDNLGSINDSDEDEELNDLSDVGQEDSTEANIDDDGSMGEEVDRSDIDVERDQELEENAADNDKTEEAGSPVDTDPGDDEDGDENGLLQHRRDDAVTDNDNAASSDGQGISEATEPQTNAKDQNESSAQGTSGHEGNQPTKDDAQAEASDGEPGDVATNPSSSYNQHSAQSKTNESEAFKKLGDALEKWHRQSRRIHEATKDDQVKHQLSNEPDAPEQGFKHLPNEDAETDTQALGPATEDQVHALDRRALESETKEQPQEFMPEDAVMEDAVDEAGSMGNEDHDMTGSEDEEGGARAGALVGPNPRLQDVSRSEDDLEEESEQNIEDLDNELSTIHLANEADDHLRSAEEARRLWSHYESLTRELALSLTEQLRLILAPTLATKMRGDFRTGKRLNIKRIIPYIASQYKRDKIWMRRSVPSKRNYQILLAVDDSKSMGESGSGQLAFETLALISKSLSMLEVGQICVVGFGNDVRVAHEFDQTFSSEAGVQVFQQFTFQQAKTNVRKLIAGSIELFRDARSKSFNAGTDLWQLELIISDGVCEDHETIRRLVRQAQEERIMMIFVIVDSLKGESIMDMTQATFEPDEAGETKLKIKRYLDGFPFGYYLIVGDVKELPGVLATALRQWFAEVTEST